MTVSPAAPDPCHIDANRDPDPRDGLEATTDPVTVDPDTAGAFHDILNWAAPEGNQHASPLFAIVLAGPARLAALERLLRGTPVPLIHLGEAATFHEPLELNAHLDCRAAVSACRPRLRGATVTLSTTLLQPPNRPVAQLTTTLQIPVPGQWPTFGTDREGPAPIRPKTFRTVRVVQAGEDLTRRWAQITGDWQPIHTDDAAARSVGFRQRILHGSFTWAMTGQLLLQELGAGDPSRLRGLRVRFAKPVHPGDHVRVQVTDPVIEAEGHRQYAFRALARGRVVLRDGWFELGRESDPS